jgi:lysyl-tRNA synthetase class 2
MSAAGSWRPYRGAGPEELRRRLALRADLLAKARAFFAARGVTEVDTLHVVRHAVTDRHLASARVSWPSPAAPSGYLHTSPEYAMKRLLAAGSGDIYQLCHVYRGDEQGALHNGEFMLLEWYRCGFDMHALVREVDALLRELLGSRAGAAAGTVSYCEAFRSALGCDPLADELPRLAARARDAGLDARLVDGLGRDELLDLMMAERVGPRLGLDGPMFVHSYPASQAALARLDPADTRVARRFELYLGGIELANGFEELADPVEQRARFEADRALRAQLGLGAPVPDEFLLAALASGLPACSGVALGFDRLMMRALGAGHIADVLPFTSAEA